MQQLKDYTPFVARVLMSLLFLLAGYGKLMAVGPTADYMQAMGVPGVLVYPTILFELGVGILLTVGYQVRYVALAAAAFSVLTALIFHTAFSDPAMAQTNIIMLLKNLSIAGGFLLLALNGAGKVAIDKA